jgi:glycosyltransferase 2 family protein
VRLLPLGLAVVLLAVIYARVDVTRVLGALGAADPLWLGLAFACFIPQIAVTALRWRWLVRGAAPISRWESCRQVLASSTLNVITPSKLGDLAKGWFVARGSAVPLGQAMSLALAEKLLDLWALSAVLLGATLLRGAPADPLVVSALVLAAGVFAAVALALVAPLPDALIRHLPRRAAALPLAWNAARRLALAGAGRRAGIGAVSLGLWLLHVAQIYLFFRAVGVAVSALQVYALVPVAILVGLLPITQGGFGTRDAALIHLFAGDASPAVLAAVGLLTGTRYLVPGLIGLPFLPLALQARAAVTRPVPVEATPPPAPPA